MNDLLKLHYDDFYKFSVSGGIILFIFGLLGSSYILMITKKFSLFIFLSFLGYFLSAIVGIILIVWASKKWYSNQSKNDAMIDLEYQEKLFTVEKIKIEYENIKEKKETGTRKKSKINEKDLMMELLIGNLNKEDFPEIIVFYEWLNDWREFEETKFNYNPVDKEPYSITAFKFLNPPNVKTRFLINSFQYGLEDFLFEFKDGKAKLSDYGKEYLGKLKEINKKLNVSS